MSEVFFDPEVTIENVAKALHNPDIKTKWDKDLEHA